MLKPHIEKQNGQWVMKTYKGAAVPWHVDIHTIAKMPYDQFNKFGMASRHVYKLNGGYLPHPPGPVLHYPKGHLLHDAPPLPKAPRTPWWEGLLILGFIGLLALMIGLLILHLMGLLP